MSSRLVTSLPAYPLGECVLPIVVDARIRYFPEDAGLRGQIISMHHIDGLPMTSPLRYSRHLASHVPGGFRYNPGGIGSQIPFYPAEEPAEPTP